MKLILTWPVVFRKPPTVGIGLKRDCEEVIVSISRIH